MYRVSQSDLLTDTMTNDKPYRKLDPYTLQEKYLHWNLNSSISLITKIANI